MNRRTAITVLGSASLAMAIGFPLYADESKGDVLRKVLPKFTDRSRTLLLRLLDDPAFSGQIPAKEVATLTQAENLTVDNLMLALLPLAQSYSHAPISNFFVGVVVRGASGSLYTGANIEIPGQCLGLAVHAEQSAISNAYMHSERAVTALAVGGAPCGHCRQFINEASPEGEILILTPDKPPAKLSSILPSAFGPAALGMKEGAFPVREANLTLAKPSSEPLTVAALDAARNSYAPYSKSPSGVAIRGSRGRVYRGSYIENVAFNPSLSPLQTAFAALIAAGEPYSAISEVALVEFQGATISQKAVTEIVLGAIAPAAKLEVVSARV
jgi:cytidine deaminase